jgi:hypothetical protein
MGVGGALCNSAAKIFGLGLSFPKKHFASTREFAVSIATRVEQISLGLEDYE